MSPIEMGPLRILHNCWVYVFEGWDLVSIILEIKITNHNLAHCSLFARIESEFQSKLHDKVKYGGCVGERTPIRAEDRLFLLCSQYTNTQLHWNTNIFIWIYTNMNRQIQTHTQIYVCVSVFVTNTNPLSELMIFSSCFNFPIWTNTLSNPNKSYVYNSVRRERVDPAVMK